MAYTLTGPTPLVPGPLPAVRGNYHPRNSLIEAIHGALLHPQVGAAEKATYGKLLASVLAEQAKAHQAAAQQGAQINPVGSLSGHYYGGPDVPSGQAHGAVVDAAAAAPAPTWVNGHSSIEQPAGGFSGLLSPLAAAALGAAFPSAPVQRGAVL